MREKCTDVITSVEDKHNRVKIFFSYMHKL